MKDVYWYYREFNRLEKEIKECQITKRKEELENELEKLDDEFLALGDD